MRRKLLADCAILFFLSASIANSAFSQETGKTEKPEGQELNIEYSSDEGRENKSEVAAFTIEVTAEKRQKKTKDLPYSLTVLNSEDIEKNGIENAENVSHYVPNAIMTGTPSRNVFVIRGISSFSTSIYSPVGMYIDDVCMPLHLSNNPDIYDVERIEVLKGPQGTLYGRNSEAGVINIVTKKPGNDLKAGIKEEFSVYDTGHGYVPVSTASAHVSLPLKKDVLYFRTAGSWRISDGYIKNTYKDDEKAGKIDHLNLRGSLRFTPGNLWDITLNADGIKNDDGAAAFRYSTGQNKTKQHEVSMNSDTFKKELGYGQSLKIKFDANAFDIISVTGHRYYENDFQNDRDCTSSSMIDRGANHYEWENRIVSEELRFVSDKNKTFEWLLGLYAFHEDTAIDFENKVAADEKETDIDIDGYSAFGQGTISFLEMWHFTAGVRYDNQNLTGELNDTADGEKYSRDLLYNEILPKFSLSCDPVKNIMTYASASKGYMTGGYNYATSTDKDSFTYDPEYTWNYETGVKTLWLKNRLGIDLSFFYIDIKDKQVLELDLDSMADTVKNAAKAHSAGFECQIFAEPVRGLRLNASFGYSDVRFDSWESSENRGTPMAPDIVEIDYKDKRVPYSSLYTYNAGISYEHRSGLSAGLNLRGTGDFYSDPENTMKEDGYVLTDTKISYKIGHFTLDLWCKNIFDQGYYSYINSISNSRLVIDGEPRRFGLSMKAEL